MWDVEKIINSKNAFIGLLSTNYLEQERKPRKDHIKSYFNNGGGMVYICSNDKEEYCINYLKNIWEFDINYLIKKGRLKFINRENFVLIDDIDICRLLDIIERAVDILYKKGSNKNQVYITLDSSWNSIGNKRIEYFYDRLITMNREGKTGFILRYIIEEFSRKYIYYILDYHDFILVDRIDGFEYYTPDQLVYESLTLLTKHHTFDDRYEKEAMRNEYLKTLGELMEGTVHDINNLLVTILGYAQLSLYIEDLKEMKEYLQIINKTALDGKIITDRIKNHIRGSYESLKDIYEFDYIINNCVR